jgi:hypothetical protein
MEVVESNMSVEEGLSCLVVLLLSSLLADTVQDAQQQQQLQEQPLPVKAVQQAQRSDLDALLESSRALIASLDSTFGTQQAVTSTTNSTTGTNTTVNATTTTTAAGTAAGVHEGPVPKRSSSSSGGSVSMREQAAHNAATVLTPTDYTGRSTLVNGSSADNRCVTTT